jgi:hypothetical protein
MTTTFSFPRLLQLIRKQWFENSRLYIFSILAMLGILGLVMIFWVITDEPNYSEDSLYIIFLFGLFIAGSVFASMSFSMLGNKERGTYWLAFPASHLEKLICMIFYNVVVFTAVYCACFFLLKSMALSYVNSLVAGNKDYSFRVSSWDSDRSFLGIVPYFLYGYFAVQSFYLLGSVYFPRYSFVITTVVGSALILVFVYYSAEILKGSFYEEFSWNGDHLRKYEGDFTSYKRYDLSPVLTDILTFAIKFIWAPVFWVVAWFRLKEKQI